MEFRILGSLAVIAGGVVAELGPPKQRALLAILLMHVGEIVPIERLIDLLWGEDAPRTAPHSIQIYVSELRKALEPLAGAELLQTRQPGYVLDADADAVDAVQFERLVRDGVRELEAGDAESGRFLLRQALGLWHGPALADFAYEEFAQPHIRRLNEMHLDAVEILAAAELEAGRTAEAITLLAAAIRDDPLRERSRELLMLALYRSGRHADALRTFDALRAGLADELGIDPSPGIRRLYDRILLHDPALMPQPEMPEGDAAARNPYKGLRPFAEEDAPDFFGRDELVAQLVDALNRGARLLALVGPSGSGKSSAVSAGLVPQLRAGAIEGSETWRLTTMVPGTNPLRDAERAVAGDEAGVDPRSVDLSAPASGQETVLIIDQFELAFSVPDDAARSEFLSALADAVSAPDGRLVVILTMRADFYDRPLLHPRFAAVFTPSVVNVLPMTPQQIEAAIVEPAARVGVTVEPALLAELVADTADRPGSLPLLQFALTELFEQRSGPSLGRSGYAALGGLRGLLSRRAEDLYRGLQPEAQSAAMQVFLRLVQSADGGIESRRRLDLSELTDLGIDTVVLSEILSTFGDHRLLTFDRDPFSGQATVEVAHEALLAEWERLAGWIDRHRAVLRRHAALTAAADEWELSGRNHDYLLTGSRLEEFEPWLVGGVLQLSGRERAFLEAGRDRRQAAEDAERERVAAERRLSRRARRRFVALALTVVALSAGLTYAVIIGVGARALRVVAFDLDPGVVTDIVEAGFDRGVLDFGLNGVKVDAQVTDPADYIDLVVSELRSVSAESPALIVTWGIGGYVDDVARDYPDVDYIAFDWIGEQPNVEYVEFSVWDGAFLAGVAAALKTNTGIVGVVGGTDSPPVWGFQAGFAAGAQAADPHVRVLTEYLGGFGDYHGFADAPGAKRAAEKLYRDGADIIFNVAGNAGLGVFEAAVEMSATGRELWAIGVDSDQYETVAALPGVIDPDQWRAHILTSVVKRFDLAVYEALGDVKSGSFAGGLHSFNLTNGGVDISYSGGFIDDYRATLESYRARIVEGAIRVPCVPDDRVELAAEVAQSMGITLGQLIGTQCPGALVPTLP